MASVRDFVGAPCPHCKNDILQQAPSTNRMPGEARAWCPSCQHRFGVEELSRGVRPAKGILRRLFGGANPQ